MRFIHRVHTGSDRYRVRSTRGVTLIATVLLSILVATIALVVVRATVLSTRTEAVRTDFGRANALADQIKADFERDLAADPVFYTKRLFGYERPRNCLATTSDPALNAFPWVVPNANPTVPGPAWPAACGDTWNYPAVGQGLVGWDASAHDGRVELNPPSAESPQMTLTILAAVGQAESGLQVVYEKDSAAKWTLYSEQSLDMQKLLHPSTGAEVAFGPNATAYTNDVMRLPTSSVTVDKDRLVANRGFIGSVPSSSTTRLFTGVTGSGSQASLPGFAAMSSVTGKPLTVQALRASAGPLDAAGCPVAAGSDPANLSMDASTSAVYPQSSYLCLRPGYKVVDTTNVVRAVPSKVGAWLIVPDGTTSSQAALKVYYSPTRPATGSACVLGKCSARAAAARDAAAGRSVAGGLPENGPSVWTALGTFRYPSTQVVATSTTTFLGRCTGFASSSCGTEPSEPAGGWRFVAPTTFLAGSQAAPADVWVSGDLRTSERVGVVATGRLIVPAFAAPANATLTTEVFFAALGFGTQTGTTDVVGIAGDATTDTMMWSLTGSLAAPRLGEVAGVRSIAAAPPPGSAVGQPVVSPSMFVGFSLLPRPTSSQRLTSTDVCGSELNNADSGSVATCRGLW